MPLAEQTADNAGVIGQCRRVDCIQRDGALHVAELPHVVLQAVDGGPPEQRIADCLQGLLVLHDPLSLMGMPGRIAVDEPGQHRPPRLLELQEYHIVRAAALEQRNIGAQSDAADPDHLVRNVDQRVAAQRPAPMWRQGGQVLIEPDGDALCLGLGDSGDQRRFIHDLQPLAAPCGEARQRTIAGSGSRALCGAQDGAPQRFFPSRLVQPVDVEPLVGSRQQRLISKETHFLAIGGDARCHRVATLPFVGSIVSPGDPDAGRQTPQIPLPGAGMRLVEIVQVDNEIPFRRGVETEVAKMRITADHRTDAGRRQRCDILGHHAGGAPQEPVGRGHHAGHPDRDQPRKSAFMRLHDLHDRIRPVGRGLPLAQRTARHLLTQTAAELESLGSRHRPAAQGPIAVAVCAGQHHMPRGHQTFPHARRRAGPLRRRRRHACPCLA